MSENYIQFKEWINKYKFILITEKFTKFKAEFLMNERKIKEI